MWMRNVKQVKWSEDKQVSSRPYIFWLLLSNALKKRHHELTARMHVACLWGQQLPCLHGQRCLASKARSAWDATRVPELQAVPMCHYCHVPGVFALSFSINRSFILPIKMWNTYFLCLSTSGDKILLKSQVYQSKTHCQWWWSAFYSDKTAEECFGALICLYSFVHAEVGCISTP